MEERARGQSVSHWSIHRPSSAECFRIRLTYLKASLSQVCREGTLGLFSWLSCWEAAVNSTVTGGVPEHMPPLSRPRHSNIPRRVIGGFLHGSVMFIDCLWSTNPSCGEDKRNKTKKRPRKNVHRATRSRHGRQHSRGRTSGMPETGERKRL